MAALQGGEGNRWLLPNIHAFIMTAATTPAELSDAGVAGETLPARFWRKGFAVRRRRRISRTITSSAMDFWVEGMGRV